MYSVHKNFYHSKVDIVEIEQANVICWEKQFFFSILAQEAASSILLSGSVTCDLFSAPTERNVRSTFDLNRMSAKTVHRYHNFFSFGDEKEILSTSSLNLHRYPHVKCDIGKPEFWQDTDSRLYLPLSY